MSQHLKHADPLQSFKYFLYEMTFLLLPTVVANNYSWRAQTSGAAIFTIWNKTKPQLITKLKSR